MQRHLARQTQVLRNRERLGPRRSLSLPQTCRTSVPHTQSTGVRSISLLTRARRLVESKGTTFLDLATRKPIRKILIAWITFKILVSSVYEPLRDHGFLGDLADSTIFRTIPPKLAEVPEGIDETKYRPLTGEKETRLLTSSQELLATN